MPRSDESPGRPELRHDVLPAILAANCVTNAGKYLRVCCLPKVDPAIVDGRVYIRPIWRQHRGSPVYFPERENSRRYGGARCVERHNAICVHLRKQKG